MPVNTSEILSLVSKICEEEKLRVAFTESLKGGFIAGGTTIIGGLLAGPLGLAAGTYILPIAAWNYLYSSCLKR